MDRIEQIKKRMADMLALENALMTAGPSKAEKLIEQQSQLQEHYYSDVSELLETIDTAIYELDRLEPLLEMPERGYVRNGFNSILRTLMEG